MDEQTPNPGTPPAPQRSSLAARMLNVFATPGDVFDEIKNSPHSV